MKNLLRLFTLLSLVIGNIAFADMRYPVMRFSPEEMRANQEKNFMALRTVSHSSVPSRRHVDLMQYVSTNSTIRNQKSCGNCWVWANMAALEVRKNIQDGLSSASPDNSLSVGFFNSFYNNGGRNGSFACKGGNTFKFIDFFKKGGEANQRVIPWSNENAGFADGDGGTPYMNTHISNVYKDDIDISRYYLTTNILHNYAAGPSDADALVQDLKYYLYNKYPIVLLYFLPTEYDWDDFYDYWEHGSINQMYDIGSAPAAYNSAGLGHLVLIVGYDDTSNDINEHYWIALNSWGAPSNRPQGTFRIKMRTNYQSYVNVDNQKYYRMQWHVIDPVFASQNPYIDTKQISGKVVDVGGSGVKDVAVKFDNRDVVLTDNNGLFSFAGGQIGQNYTLDFERAGYKFSPASYQGKVNRKNNYIEVSVVNDPAYTQCKGKGVAIKNIGKGVDAIKKLSKTAIGKMKNKGNSSEVLENLVKTYDNAFNSYPRVVYKCPSSCGKVGYGSNKTALKKAITKIVQGAISNWSKCVKQKKVKAKVFNQKKKLIIAKRTAVLKQLAKLPAKGALCK